MIKGKRTTDQHSSSIYYRADRVSLINGQFFFSTREGTLEGPYRSRREACEAIESYIRRMTAPKPAWAGGKASGFSLSLSD